MHWSHLVLTFHVAVLILGGGLLARPMGGGGGGRRSHHHKKDNAESSSKGRGGGGSSGGKKTKSGEGRRMRMLHKMLRRLTPEDVMQLAATSTSRSKKNSQNVSASSFAGPHGTQRDFGTGAASGKFVVPAGVDLSRNNNKNSIDSEQALPEIDCPRARDGVQLFSCPTPDRYGIYRCIDDHALCDNKPDCPNREDENKTVCMFHKMTMNYFKVLMDAVFGLTRSIVV